MADKLLRNMSDIDRRKKVTVSPFDVNFEKSVDQYFRYYQMCDLIIAMRFHANIFALTQNIPCIALAGHSQVSGLYDDLHMKERCLIMNQTDFSKELLTKVEYILNNKEEAINMQKKVIKGVCKEQRAYIDEVKAFITQFV